MKPRATCRLLASAVLAASCTVPSSSSSSSAVGGSGGGGSDLCVIGFAPSETGISAAHGLVTGTVTVKCSHSTQILVVVTLSYDSGNGMRQVSSGQFDGVTMRTRVTTTPANCYEGRYRAAYTATARANGDVRNQHQVSDAVTLSAGDCHR